MSTSLIERALPQCALKTPPHLLDTLKAITPRLHASLKTITSSQNVIFKDLIEQRWAARNHIEAELASALDLTAFAEPLLKQHIQKHYSMDLNVHEVFINLYSPPYLPVIGLPDSGALSWRMSLLDAALHNFEAYESSPSAILPHSGYINRPDELGRYTPHDDITRKMPIAGFINLCRSLDLGARYQAYLNELLGLNDRGKQLRLKQKIRASQLADLQADLVHGVLNQSITVDAQESLGAFIQGNANDWQTFDLALFSIPIDGVLIFRPDHQRFIVAFIPHDPATPIKEFSSTGRFIDHLTERLKAPTYQHFFSRFIGHDQLGAYFSALKHTYFRVITDKPNAPDFALQTFGFIEELIPVALPQLKYSTSLITEDVWEILYSRKLARIFKDAKTLAVSTDTEDRKTRQARWDLLKQIGSTLLNAAMFVIAPFVPVVGELMLVQMAYQLLDDVYEGVHDWVEGDTLQAYEHLFSILESAIQVGLFAAGTKIVGDLIIKPSLFVEGLKPVISRDGKTRLWRPDLQPYSVPEPLPRTLQYSDKGLHQSSDAEFLTVADKTFRVEQSGRPPRYRIKHPVRSETYAPRLQHNGMGAWSAETETPLNWSDKQLFQRLSPAYAQLGDEAAARILAITRTDSAVLRTIHTHALPTPALLADTAQRFKIEQDIERFIAFMENPSQRMHADPQTQLQLLVSHEQWPANKGLRVLNQESNVIAQYPTARSDLPFLDILDSQINAGELLSTVVNGLDDTEIRLLLGESPAFGDELPNKQVQTNHLYRILARMAHTKRAQLFDSRYATLELHSNNEVALLQKEFVGLPRKSAEEMIWHASGDEILQLLNDKTIPIRLQEEARWQLLETRVNRAYEGMFLDSVNHSESEWLTLKTIERLPGWSPNVRLEIREDQFEGRLLNSLGDDNAPIRKVLIKSNHQYSARDALDQELHGPDDLYGALLHALPDEERQALGFAHVGEGSSLKDAVRQHPLLPRLPVTLYLEHPAVAEDFKSPMQLTYGRERYPLLGADAPEPRRPTIDRLAYELYPTLNARERARAIATLPVDEASARQGLADRRRELETMRDDLEVWTLNSPAVNQRNGEMLSPNSRIANVQDRRAFSRELERCWRRQTAFDNHYGDPTRDGFELVFTRPIHEEMPPVSADFSHVTYLSLYGAGPVVGVNEFLMHFPQLRVLDLRGFELDVLPEALSRMTQLRELRLENSAITLTLESANRLAALEYLEYIDLDHNPLNITPDFSNMPNLNTLHLSNTELSQFPLSILSLSELEVIDLSDNLIVDLPSELFDAPAYIPEALDLEGNPLSAQSLNRVREYFSQTGFDMNIDLENAHEIAPAIIEDADE